MDGAQRLLRVRHSLWDLRQGTVYWQAAQIDDNARRIQRVPEPHAARTLHDWNGLAIGEDRRGTRNHEQAYR